jgi:hypothetical protein
VFDEDEAVVLEPSSKLFTPTKSKMASKIATSVQRESKKE